LFPTIGSQEEVEEEEEVIVVVVVVVIVVVIVVVVVVVIVVVIEEYYNATKRTLFIFFTTFHSFCRSVFTAQNLMTLYGCFFSSFFFGNQPTLGEKLVVYNLGRALVMHVSTALQKA
jgi:heme/copper-type cytochrome/quinol oxidase subunit 2